MISGPREQRPPFRVFYRDLDRHRPLDTDDVQEGRVRVLPVLSDGSEVHTTITTASSDSLGRTKSHGVSALAIDRRWHERSPAST